MEAVQYLLDFFFNWTNGGFWHFVELAFLCWLIGSPCRVSVYEPKDEKQNNGTTQQ